MIYALGTVIALLVVTVVLLSLKLRSGLDTERSLVATALESGKNQLAAERELLRVTTERDELHVRFAESELKAAKALRALNACETAVRDLAAKEGEHAVAKIRAAATPDDARRVLDDLMSSPLPGLPGPAADPVSPAAAAGDSR